MSMFRNAHIVIALLIAPVLALLAWFSVDFLFGERPQAAVPGESYPLAELPGCRYAGGACGLKNADFELRISIERGADGRAVLDVASEFPLDGVIAALVAEQTGERGPLPLRRVSPGGQAWRIELPAPQPGSDRLRIAASAAGSQYFGEVSTTFLQEPD